MVQPVLCTEMDVEACAASCRQYAGNISRTPTAYVVKFEPLDDRGNPATRQYITFSIEKGAGGAEKARRAAEARRREICRDYEGHVRVHLFDSAGAERIQALMGMVEGDASITWISTLEVQIAQAHRTSAIPEILLQFQRYFGGAIYDKKVNPKVGANGKIYYPRPQSQWEVHSTLAVRLLQLLADFGVFKYVQARIVLKALEGKSIEGIEWRLRKTGPQTRAALKAEHAQEAYRRIPVRCGNITIAWIAGFSDAECCMRLTRAGIAYFRITQVGCRQVLPAIQAVIGGTVTASLLHLVMQGDHALKVVASISPWLVQKRCEADLILSYSIDRIPRNDRPKADRLQLARLDEARSTLCQLLKHEIRPILRPSHLNLQASTGSVLPVSDEMQEAWNELNREDECPPDELPAEESPSEPLAPGRKYMGPPGSLDPASRPDPLAMLKSAAMWGEVVAGDVQTSMAHLNPGPSGDDVLAIALMLGQKARELQTAIAKYTAASTSPVMASEPRAKQPPEKITQLAVATAGAELKFEVKSSEMNLEFATPTLDVKLQTTSTPQLAAHGSSAPSKESERPTADAICRAGPNLESAHDGMSARMTPFQITPEHAAASTPAPSAPVEPTRAPKIPETRPPELVEAKRSASLSEIGPPGAPKKRALPPEASQQAPKKRARSSKSSKKPTKNPWEKIWAEEDALPPPPLTLQQQYLLDDKELLRQASKRLRLIQQSHGHIPLRPPAPPRDKYDNYNPWGPRGL